MESNNVIVTLSGKSLDEIMALIVGNTRSEKDNCDIFLVMAKTLGSNKCKRSVS